MTLKPPYPNPPITEAILQLRFNLLQPWSVATPGRIFEKLSHDYPLEPEIARTEAANTGIKQIKRTGRGYKNPAHYQARILLRSAARRAA